MDEVSGSMWGIAFLQSQNIADAARLGHLVAVWWAVLLTRTSIRPNSATARSMIGLEEGDEHVGTVARERDSHRAPRSRSRRR